jgi:formate hydrogenlyase transcriptional activator
MDVQSLLVSARPGIVDGLPFDDDALSRLAAGFIGLPAEAIGGHVEVTIGSVAARLGLDRAALAEWSPHDARLTVTHQWTRAGVAPIALPNEADLPWVVARIVAGETVLFHRPEDLAPEAGWDREHLARSRVRSGAVFALVVGGRLTGALAFSTLRHECDWTPRLVERLRLVADIVASALDRQRAERTQRQALEFERLLSGVAASLIDVAPEAVDGRIVTALRSVGELLDLDRVTVLQRSAEDGALWRTHQWARDGVPGLRANEREDAYSWAASRLGECREPLIVSRLDELPVEAGAERAILEQRSVRALAVLPLVAGDAVTGMLALVSLRDLRDERAWRVEMVSRLRLCGDAVATALARRRADAALRASLAENEQLRRQLEAENLYLRSEVHEAHDGGEIVGQSPALRAVLHKVDQVAGTDTAVLLLGETGTGKELFAHAIHARSRRRGRRFIAVNCAALPATLVESELFGHEKGAFTGAAQAKPGRFELADGGTLFLDEIGDLGRALQAKLLRALQDGEIQRLGATRARRVDVRVIAATNRDLEQALREGRFRDDLYYRLSVFPIELPPLRERRDDIPLLVWYFIQSRQRSLGRAVERVPRAAMDALQAYDWPGNVRELQNVIERALILSRGPALRLHEAFQVRHTAGPTAPLPVADTLRAAERAHILGVLERCRWRIEGRSQAAERLGLKPSTLRNRMKKLSIQRPRPAA